MNPSTRLDVDSPRGHRSLAISDEPSLRLTDLLRQHHLALNTRCGQRGLCDGCFVELLDGEVQEAVTRSLLVAEDKPLRLRACQYSLASGAYARIRLLARSLLAHEPQIVTSFRLEVPRAHDPLWQVVTAPRGQLSQNIPRHEIIGRLVAQKHPGKVPLLVDNSLAEPAAHVEGEYRLALRQEGNHWSLRKPTRAQCRQPLGVAIDLGTTTVVVLLVDLNNGHVIAEASALNAQADFGDNVLTRINHCMSDRAMVRRLQSAVVARTVEPLLEDVLRQADASADQLACMVAAGNTTMLHLLSGVDPTSMGAAPFTPSFLDHRVKFAGELPWQSVSGVTSSAAAACWGRSPRRHPAPFPANRDELGPPIHLLPSVAAYIGADVVAGLLSTGVAYAPDTSLLVDVGTNGEIVLKHGDQLFACATAAGPAFEGAGLSCGVRAGKGAIDHVKISAAEAKLEFDVIGGGKPVGICGTAYIDLIAQLRAARWLGPTGRLTDSSREVWTVEEFPCGKGLVIASGIGQEPIYVTEGDIASLLQAKAAIAAGILCLLQRAGLQSTDVKKVYLAGGFGLHIDPQAAVDMGLLPGFAAKQIEPVGNSSLAGAYLALLDSSALDEMKRVAAKVNTIELNLEPTFESQYIDQLLI